ncbi:hypothetical protein [Roseateles sp.]|uniref:hypothetical protein n=1 Tax=Roseateles sp. TaxID=1971397 RepID=UPI003266611D
MTPGDLLAILAMAALPYVLKEEQLSAAEALIKSEKIQGKFVYSKGRYDCGKLIAGKVTRLLLSEPT